MAILNFTGFEADLGVESLEIIGTPRIASLSDEKDIHSGEYSLAVSSYIGDGYGGITLGEISGGSHVPMNRNRIFTRFYCCFKEMPIVSTEFFAIKDINDNIKMSLRINAAGDLIVKGYSTTTSNAGDTFITYPAKFEQNSWYRLEIQTVSNGSTEIKINGTSLGFISLISNNLFISKVMLGSGDDGYDGHDEGYTYYIDDIVIRNDSYPGSGNITLLEPLSFGYYSEWRGQIEDILDPFDDFFIKARDGRKNTFIFYIKDGTYLGTINSIKLMTLCNSPTGEISKAKNFLRMDNTDYFENSFIKIPDSSYYPITSIYEKDMSNSNWTRNSLKNLQYGIVSSDDTTSIYCDHITLQIDYS